MHRHSYGPVRVSKAWSPASVLPRVPYFFLGLCWLGQDNGMWGLSRGHSASWAVLLVLSGLCSCQMGAVARAGLPLSEAGPLNAG